MVAANFPLREESDVAISAMLHFLCNVTRTTGFFFFLLGYFIAGGGVEQKDLSIR